MQHFPSEIAVSVNEGQSFITGLIVSPSKQSDWGN